MIRSSISVKDTLRSQALLSQVVKLIEAGLVSERTVALSDGERKLEKKICLAVTRMASSISNLVTVVGRFL